jgi:hypothetical protein
MNKRKVASSIVTGDVVFKTHDKEFDFDVKQMASLFSTTMSFAVPNLDLHWHEIKGFKAENKTLILTGQYSWKTVRVQEPITSGVHYIELEVVKAKENAFLVGVVTTKFFNPGDDNNAYIKGEHGWAIYLPDGKKYHKESFETYTEPVGRQVSNQRVGLILNMDNHTLAYVMNDVIQPVAFTGLPNELYLAVSVIHKDDIIRINEVDSYKRFRMIHGISKKTKKSAW